MPLSPIEAIIAVVDGICSIFTAEDEVKNLRAGEPLGLRWRVWLAILVSIVVVFGGAWLIFFL